MTEQEVKALVARLTRVWGPPSQEPHWKPEKAHFVFVAYVAFESLLMYSVIDGWPSVTLEPELYAHQLVYQDGQIREYRSDISMESDDRAGELSQQLMEFFRRGLWLSGCDIEATAHEKAEWGQRFSREEIDAWNLKI